MCVTTIRGEEDRGIKYNTALTWRLISPGVGRQRRFQLRLKRYCFQCIDAED